jgi:hypothetical protein
LNSYFSNAISSFKGCDNNSLEIARYGAVSCEVSSLSTKEINSHSPTKKDESSTQEVLLVNSSQNLTVSTVRRGRKKTLDDMGCLKIYRQHYQGGISIKSLAEGFNWVDSPFADNPVFETARDRIKVAIKRGRKLTPLHDRPAKDKAGRK